jgi:hypothetical protein
MSTKLGNDQVSLGDDYLLQVPSLVMIVLIFVYVQDVSSAVRKWRK